MNESLPPERNTQTSALYPSIELLLATAAFRVLSVINEGNAAIAAIFPQSPTNWRRLFENLLDLVMVLSRCALG